MRKLRCEPGVLAIVINDLDQPRNNGKMVRVIRRADQNHYYVEVDWGCECLQDMVDCDGPITRAGTLRWGYRDSELLPIRDPDQDATDETLLWLPVPNTNKEEELA